MQKIFFSFNFSSLNGAESSQSHLARMTRGEKFFFAFHFTRNCICEGPAGRHSPARFHLKVSRRKAGETFPCKQS